MFFGPKRVAGGVVWVRKRDTGAEARWKKTWSWKGECITKSQLGVLTNGVFTCFIFFHIPFLLYFGTVERVLFCILHRQNDLRMNRGFLFGWRLESQKLGTTWSLLRHSGILWGDNMYIRVCIYICIIYIYMYYIYMYYIYIYICIIYIYVLYIYVCIIYIYIYVLYICIIYICIIYMYIYIYVLYICICIIYIYVLYIYIHILYIYIYMYVLFIHGLVWKTETCGMPPNYSHLIGTYRDNDD